jgi:hypothetical protein
VGVKVPAGGDRCKKVEEKSYLRYDLKICRKQLAIFEENCSYYSR